MVQKSKEAEQNLNEVESTLEAVLREDKPFMLQCAAQPEVSHIFLEENILTILRTLKEINPDEYTKLTNDPEKREFIEELLDKRHPGMKLSENDD